MSFGLPSRPLLPAAGLTPSVHLRGPAPGPPASPSSSSLCVLLSPGLGSGVSSSGKASLTTHPVIPLDAKILPGTLQSTLASPRASGTPRRVWAPQKRGLVWNITSVHMCKPQNRTWHRATRLGPICPAEGLGWGRESQGELVLKDEGEFSGEMAFPERGNYIRASRGLRTATGSPASASSDGLSVWSR